MIQPGLRGFKSYAVLITAKLRETITRRRDRQTVPSSRASLIKLSSSFSTRDNQTQRPSSPRSGAHAAENTVKA